MKEYVEREAAIFRLREAIPYHENSATGLERAISYLQSIPAADVVEVRPGRWIYTNMGGWKCSECNNQAPFWCMASTQNLSNYCPNCGAKMDGGADDAAD